MTPQFSALSKVPGLTISEERGWWIKGRIDHSFFEISFEDWQRLTSHADKVFPVPGVCVTYIGLFSGKATFAEFTLGFWSTKPRDDETRMQLTTIFRALKGVWPEVPHNIRPPVYRVDPHS